MENHKKNHKRNAQKIKFGHDLIQAALNELDFLRVVDSHPLLHGGPLVDQAIQRYEQLWLPLVAESSEPLLAPLDIEWVWYCHMLCPLAYEADCMNLFGRMIDHQLTKAIDYWKAVARSQTIWNRRYPHVPFQVDMDRVTDQGYLKHAPSRLTYDIAAAISRQRVFYYQVSLPHYQDRKFIEKAVIRYQKFLYLKKLNPELYIVPCYDIDLVWHAHQTHPVVYKNDTVNILGKTLDHDDSTTDRSSGSYLTVSYKATRETWRSTYNEQYSNYGSMYRGESPRGKLSPISWEECYMFSSKQVDISANHIQIKGSNPKTEFELHMMQNTESRITKDGLKIKGLTSRHQMGSVRPLAFNTRLYDSLTTSLIKNNGFGPFKSKTIFASKIFPVRSSIEKRESVNGQTVRCNLESTRGDQGTSGMTVDFDMCFSAPRLSVCTLKIKTGCHESVLIPEYKMGPMYVPTLPPGQPNNCTVATHR